MGHGTRRTANTSARSGARDTDGGPPGSRPGQSVGNSDGPSSDSRRRAPFRGPIARVVDRPVRAARDPRIVGLAVAGLALVLYWATLLHGLSFGDWGEMQTVPATLEVPHPTGFPTFVLLGRLWLIVEPFGSVAWRMNLFSALVTSIAAGLAVLIATRLGARPLIAGSAGLVLATVGTVWSEATVAEVNALHLCLTTILVYLAVRWRDDPRARWLLAGGLVGGLAVGNHLLALAALAVIAPLVLWAGRRRLLADPRPLLGGALLFVAGVSVYLFIPIRVALSPATQYPALRSWSAIWDHITGKVYSHEFEFLSAGVIGLVVDDLPKLVGYAVTQTSPIVLVAAAIGLVALVAVRRDAWAGLLTFGVFAVTVALYVGYRGDLQHYLLVAWMVVGVWFALGMEAIATDVAAAASGWRGRSGGGAGSGSGSGGPGLLARPALAGGLAVALALALPIAVGAGNYRSHDLSHDTVGDDFVTRVLGLLPRDAILFTYWDAGSPLHHATCLDGRRPDVLILAPDDWVSFRPCTTLTTIEALRSGRPIYALAIFNRGLGSIGGLYTSQYVTTLRVPYGGRGLDNVANLERLTPIGAGSVALPGVVAAAGTLAAGAAVVAGRTSLAPGQTKAAAP